MPSTGTVVEVTLRPTSVDMQRQPLPSFLTMGVREIPRLGAIAVAGCIQGELDLPEFDITDRKRSRARRGAGTDVPSGWYACVAAGG